METSAEKHAKWVADKEQKIIQENAEEAAYRLQNREAFQTEAAQLLSACKQEIDPTDRWQYRNGLRLAYLANMLGDQEEMKAIGLDFSRACCPLSPEMAKKRQERLLSIEEVRINLFISSLNTLLNNTPEEYHESLHNLIVSVQEAEANKKRKEG